ncbi:oxidoreductase [Corynebacterium sp.]|uniref:oxidoreductase n=1 Tax=Corynebacterium sp. TaxID=1720 RepID=UPI0026DAA453|nr:oxidoreductase [Corynebacterium sp.]MDO5031864.1 oxidoreductase [Corynebacterium sp.]
MPTFDPLTPLMEHAAVAQAAQRAAAALARVHRRPAALRRADVISSESLLRGARACVALGGKRIPAVEPAEVEAGPLGPVVSAYSLLGPGVQERTVRVFARAPIQVLARVDVAAGGSGTPAAEPAAAQALAQLITQGAGRDFDVLLPAVVHAEIAARELFGPRSTCVALVTARAAAIHTGLDPRGLAVPETYLNRHRQSYADALAAYPQEPAELLGLLMQAWEAGAAEADGIARAA